MITFRLGQMLGRRGHVHLSETEVGRILALNHLGRSHAFIARHLDRDESTIRRFIKRKNENDAAGQNGQNDEKRGRKRKTNTRDDRQILLAVSRDGSISIPKVKRDVAGAANLSKRSISNRIRESGRFNSYWASRKPFISLANRRKRLAWAREHVDKTDEFWDKVMWSDESPYVLRHKGKR